MILDFQALLHSTLALMAWHNGIICNRFHLYKIRDLYLVQHFFFISAQCLKQ